jgi:signal transduction histidine kinase
MHPTITDAELKIEIRDTGPGIAKKIIPKLFESGVTTRSVGSGFGLYFSRLIARDLGGDLEYDPNWNRGACFRLVLPRNPREEIARREF